MIPGVIAQKGSAAASGATGGYAASAVHFAGSDAGQGPTFLHTASLSAGTDNGFYAFSFWVLNLLDHVLNDNATLFVANPASAYAFAGTDSANPPGIVWDFSTNPNFENNWDSGLPAKTSWTHYMGSAETNLSAGSKIVRLYANDALVSPTTNIDSGGTLIAAINGHPFYFGDDQTMNFGPTIDVADVWIAPNVKLHDGTGFIPVPTRRQFIDGSGKPVNPTTWPASAVQFYGDAAHFPTNHGTGGAFTLTGSITNASTHP